jgi:NADH-quinone oxidoreductase subunit M
MVDDDEPGTGPPPPAEGAVPSGGGAVPAAGGATAVATAPARGRTMRVRDLDRRELAVVGPLIALVLVLGFYPQPLIGLITPAVEATMSDVGADPNGTTPAVGTTPAAGTGSEGTD